jgi:hypothetical protein
MAPPVEKAKPALYSGRIYGARDKDDRQFA